MDTRPLAAKLRPGQLDQFMGQAHLMTEGKPLRMAMERGQLHSMILWGPPGSGKTTLAKLLATHAKAEVENLSAVLAGVKDIRMAVERAKSRAVEGIATVLFVDEVHRFNKSQQDAFLPFIEDGTITFIGATTENPSFELNNALLSRTRVYVLKSLDEPALFAILTQALAVEHQSISKELLHQIVTASDGDARKGLNYLQLCLELAKSGNTSVNQAIVTEVILAKNKRFDKHGESFYDQISALHKSVRGSDPDASLYWLLRMLDGGCAPEYVLRRMVRMASEDIGNADPRALDITLNAWDSYDRLGLAEGELVIAQAVIYLAVAPKSNACYQAYNQAKRLIKQNGSDEVPLHLRNAPTQLMKQLGYAKKYRYTHDEPHAYAAGENYFPESLTPQQFYHPTNRGLEQKIQQKMHFLRTLDKQNA